MTPAGGPILFYDGVCNFCDASVKFVIARERNAAFHFAALQDPIAARLLVPHGISPADLDSLVVVDGDAVFTRSSAVVRMARELRGPWQLLRLLWWVPKPLRDAGYRVFASQRYRLFGKQDACIVPSVEVRARFLTT
jgi:predicted DCC family thiol-disulfide oxidoreductase YuxK